MKIIIPMSGVGSRFQRAGYKVIKPLIKVDGHPMVEHVINMFPGKDDFIFICNKEHLALTNLKEVLLGIKPSGEIVAIDPHKMGPVYAVLKAKELIDDNEQVMVSYCDFSVYWDYDDFKKTVRNKLCDGCVTAYKGFHPHLLGEGFYAGMQSDEENNMLEIREKHSFTENKMDSYQSAGSYYFSKGSYIKKYFQLLMDKNMNINGEYYVSSVYQLMKQDGLKIHIYDLLHFLQWGTPEDLEEYTYWSGYFRTKYTAGIMR